MGPAFAVGWAGYLPAARRCQRVRFSIFLCFFLRMRLRRFLIREPMRGATLPAVRAEAPGFEQLLAEKGVQYLD